MTSEVSPMVKLWWKMYMVSLCTLYSYHKLGDLSTSLEMTVLGQLFFTRKDDLSRRFFGFFQTLWMTGLRSRWRYSPRHFDQVKRVEKSPKAKQWLSFAKYQPRTVIQSVSEACHSEGWKTRRISWKGYRIHATAWWYTKALPLMIYNGKRWWYTVTSDWWYTQQAVIMEMKVYHFFVFHYSCHRLGDLSTTLEMTAPPSSFRPSIARGEIP